MTKQIRIERSENWYTDAAAYWDKVEPTVNGMLGGFASLTEMDANGSFSFIKEFLPLESQKQLNLSSSSSPPRPQTRSTRIGNEGGIVGPSPSTFPPIPEGAICDCGAGIGRVTETFLTKAFPTSKIDLVEQNGKFLEQAKKRFQEVGLINRIGHFIPIGLQDFEPEKNRYSLIWTQWVLGHLADDDLCTFLQRCKAALKEGGYIGIKENVTKAGVEIDEEDSSCTRSDLILKSIFKKAGLKLLKESRQLGFPKGLYTVKMYILQ